VEGGNQHLLDKGQEDGRAGCGSPPRATGRSGTPGRCSCRQRPHRAQAPQARSAASSAPTAPCPQRADLQRHGRRSWPSGCRSHSRQGRRGAWGPAWPVRPATRSAPGRARAGPAPPRAGSFLRRRPSFLSARHKVGGLAFTPARLSSSCAYSAKVRSLRSATRSLSVSKALASRRGAGPPTCGFAARCPSLRHACASGRACSPRPRTGPRARPGSARPVRTPAAPDPAARPCKLAPWRLPPPHHGITPAGRNRLPRNLEFALILPCRWTFDGCAPRRGVGGRARSLRRSAARGRRPEAAIVGLR
jgi:hypothetical protein